MPARGLHGEAYRGHIFWDELFVFPFLNLRFPELTRALLQYRYRRLPEARAGGQGGRVPGGDVPLAERQRRPRGDPAAAPQPELGPLAARPLPPPAPRQLAVAYNVWQYYQATGDLAFLDAYGAEMLLEIARFWASIASYDHGSGPLRDPRGHGPRRVPRRLPRPRRARAGQQRLHQRHGRLGPVPGAGDPGAAPRPPPDRAGRAARAAPGGARPLGGGQPQAARLLPRRRHHQPVRGLRRPRGAGLGRPARAATATSAAWTGSWRPRATPPTATRPPSRPTC